MKSFAIAAALAASMLLSACAQMPPARQASPPPRAELDQLFERLRTTASAEEAAFLETQIRSAFAATADQNVRGITREAVSALEGGDLATADALLAEVVRQDPDFVEAWNLRATVHYLMGDVESALKAIAIVLQLEPRHYAALNGLGEIFLTMDAPWAALTAFEKALAINPHLDSAQLQADQLRSELIGYPV